MVKSVLPPLAREKIFDRTCLALGRLTQLVGFNAKAPFVVIGTGRTGTNLLESILRTHPDVAMFPGEANELWHPSLVPFNRSSLGVPPIEIDPRHFSEVSVAHWPANHARVIRDVFAGFHWIAGPSKALVTKSAMLSFMIPQVLAVWPGAKFIHLYRFGVPVVESYVKKNYGKYSQFSYAPGQYRLHCARYWNSCILEIERRKQQLSLDKEGKLLEFSYEALCQDPTGTLGRLAAFLGVKAGGFSIDRISITDQNYKTVDLGQSCEGADLMDVMSEGLKLKGYVAAAMQA